MELKQLESFLAVAQYGSFTKAAEQLYISQPSISSHIRTLEEEFQTRLIVRTTKRVEVTEKGWELYECAKKMLKLRDDLVKSWQIEEEQILRIGASTIPAGYILPEVLPAYIDSNPDAECMVEQGDSASVIDGVLNRSYDVGLTGASSQDPLLESIPFYEDSMVLITPVEKSYIRMQSGQFTEKVRGELFKKPFIIREEGSGTGMTVRRILEEMLPGRCKLTIAARVNDQESIKNMVAGGLGISIISRKAAEVMCEEGKILMFELPAEASRRRLYLIRRKDSACRDRVDRFIDFTKKYYGL